MASPGGDERVAHMRSFVEGEGFSLESPESVNKLKAYLLTNLLRMRDEFVSTFMSPRARIPSRYSKTAASLSIPISGPIFSSTSTCGT